MLKVKRSSPILVRTYPVVQTSLASAETTALGVSADITLHCVSGNLNQKLSKFGQ